MITGNAAGQMAPPMAMFPYKRMLANLKIKKKKTEPKSKLKNARKKKSAASIGQTEELEQIL